MGFLGVWAAIKSVGSIVVNVVKKVYEVCTSDSASASYDKLGEMINKRNEQQASSNSGVPDFYRQTGQSSIEKKLSDHGQLIVRQESDMRRNEKITALQIELTRLRSSADLIDRSIKNVKIHASNLSVHYQNMRNINGLVDDVNNLRFGLKKIISTMNYNANVMAGENIRLKKIEGIDVERNYGAISQVSAYDAFDRTRELLRNEVTELSDLAGKHLRDIQALKVNAADLGGELGGQIINFVDHQIVPIVKNAESAGLLLRSEVSRLPAAVRQENGSMVFDEEGGIKFENIR